MIISIIGYGSIGKHYLNILKKLKIKKIKKILIFDDKNFNQKNQNNVEFLDIKTLKKYLDQINYSIIATPSYLHYKYAKLFLENNINVLVEKPVVLKTSHAEKLAKLSSKKKLKCWVTFQNRYNLAITKLKNVIFAKKLGNINLVDCSLFWHRNKSYYNVDWRGKYRTDGGVLANQAIHLLDTIVYIFGPIKNFTSIAGFNKKKLEAEDLILLNFEHVNGVFSSFRATTRADKDYMVSMDVLGNLKRVIVKGISLNRFYFYNKKKLYKDKNHSENFIINGKENAIGLGHKKVLNEFLNKKKSSKDLEIQKNIYLLKLIHSIYYNIILKKNSYSKVKNIKSIWGK